MHRKPNLFRKVNTTARGVRHDLGGDFKTSRNAKNDSREFAIGSMHGKQLRGLDYTPLFRFLLSKIGSDWDQTFSEAVSRLDKPDAIFWLVAKNDAQKQEMVRVGESSYFSGMFIDEDGKLQLTNPLIKAESLMPFCSCCTHTLNGKVFGGKYPSGV